MSESRLANLRDWTLGVVLVGLLLVPLIVKWTPVRVDGGSMRPALQQGDLVIVARDGEPTRGDIVLVQTRREGRYLHRVAKVLPRGLLRLRGDSNDVDDAEPVEPGDVRGVVVGVIPVGATLAKWKRS